jgi:hypothetical protein
MRALTLWLALIPAAFADDLPLWDQRTFTDPMDGSAGGWVAGTDEDPWGSLSSGDLLVATADINIGDVGGSGWGSGWAADNWLVRPASFQDGAITADVQAADDDSFGFVLNQSSNDTMYLAVYSASSQPPDMTAPSWGQAQVSILRIEGGVATELATAQATRASTRSSEPYRFARDGGQLLLRRSGRVVLDVTDPDPLPGGSAGVYVYDCGYTESWGQVAGCFFDELRVTLMDDDNDLVANDDDNCITDANADQADVDSDGIGDLCDPTDDRPEAPGDTPGDGGSGSGDPGTGGGDPGTGGGDPGTGNGTGDTGDTFDAGALPTPNDVDEVLAIACTGCDNSQPQTWSVAGAAALFLLRRRRR